MAVLIKAVSFIARRDRLDECWPMGSEGHIADAPNGSVCADEYLVRIGFMGPVSTSAFIEHAIAQGLTRFEPDGSAADFVTVDQVVGLLTPCDWLIVGSVDHEGHQIRAARWVGDESPYIIFPAKWSLGSTSTSGIPASSRRIRRPILNSSARMTGCTFMWTPAPGKRCGPRSGSRGNPRTFRGV